MRGSVDTGAFSGHERIGTRKAMCKGLPEDGHALQKEEPGRHECQEKRHRHDTYPALDLEARVFCSMLKRNSGERSLHVGRSVPFQ